MGNLDPVQGASLDNPSSNPPSCKLARPRLVTRELVADLLVVRGPMLHSKVHLVAVWSDCVLTMLPRRPSGTISVWQFPKQTRASVTTMLLSAPSCVMLNFLVCGAYRPPCSFFLPPAWFRSRSRCGGLEASSWAFSSVQVPARLPLVCDLFKSIAKRYSGNTPLCYVKSNLPFLSPQ